MILNLHVLSFEVRDISMGNKTNPLKSLRRQSLKNGNDVIYIKKSIRSLSIN